MVGLALPIRNRNDPPVGVPPEGNEPTGHLGCLGQSESVLLRGNVRSRDQETGSLSFPGVLVAKRGHLAKVGAERALGPFTGGDMVAKAPRDSSPTHCKDRCLIPSPRPALKHPAP